jgi:hypothetical protein
MTPKSADRGPSSSYVSALDIHRAEARAAVEELHPEHVRNLLRGSRRGRCELRLVALPPATLLVAELEQPWVCRQPPLEQPWCTGSHRRFSRGGAAPRRRPGGRDLRRRSQERGRERNGQRWKKNGVGRRKERK